jgi:hypothetical protein
MDLLKQILAVISCMVLVGCATSEKSFDSARIAEIRNSKTTEAELIARFGEPHDRGLTSNGLKTLTWRYVQTGLSGDFLVANSSSLIGINDARVNTLIVTVGEDGTVTDYFLVGGARDSLQDQSVVH